jgi:integrase/recombinase XerD
MKLIQFKAPKADKLQSQLETYYLRLKQQRSHRTAVRIFREYICKDLSEATELDALNFNQVMLTQDYAGNTIRQRLNILQAIYSYLLERGHVSINPFKIVPKPEKNSNQKRYRKKIETKVVRQILSTSNQESDDTPENLAMFALLFSGLRLNEVISLKVIDCRFLINEVQLHLRQTKNGKDAIFTLPDWAAKPLIKYCQNCPRNAEERLFSVSASTLQRRFKKACLAFGIDASVHDARATCISKLLADGVPLREVQSWARHANPQTTAEYDKNIYRTDKKLKF